MASSTSPVATYRYHFVVDSKVILVGITTDLDRREREHQKRWPTGRICRVGDPTSHAEAWAWEQEQTRDALSDTG